MSKTDFAYEISEERLRAYARLNLLERLQWLDDIRLFTLMVRNAESIKAEDRGGNVQVTGRPDLGDPGK